MIIETLINIALVMAAFRAAGFSTLLFDATDVAACRMYQTNDEVWQGLEKNAAEGIGAPGSIGPMSALLFGGQVLPFLLLPAAPWLSAGSLIALLAACLLSLAPRLWSARKFHQPLLGALLHPFAVLTLLWIQWAALFRQLRGLPEFWKGRTYAPETHTPSLASFRRGPVISRHPASNKAQLTLKKLSLWSAICVLGCACGLGQTNVPASGHSPTNSVVFAPISLADQYGTDRRCDFKGNRLTVLTIANRQGFEQIGAWVLAVKERYGTKVDIEGIADVSAVPGPLRAMIRKKLKARVEYPIMLDWSGEVIRRFDLSKNVANVFLVGDRGKLLLTMHGLPDKTKLEKLFSAIDSGLGITNRVTLDPAKQTPSSRVAR